MRTLFGKLVLWFAATVIVTAVAVMTVAAIGAEENETHRPLFAALLDVQFIDAREAYEVGGPAALEEHLERFRAMTSAQVVMTDSAGRDLVTGADRSDLIQAVTKHSHWSWLRPTRAILARTDAQHGYWYFLIAPRRTFWLWLFEPTNLLVIVGVIMLLSWFFARHLTKPLRELQAAVERFGHGDFQKRVATARRDELGQLARTFDQMADRMEMLLAAERRLLGDISHELRSPLARLSLAVELARNNPNPEPQLDRIQKEADRLNALVGELLEVTRAEGDPSKLRLETVRLDELVEDIVEDARLEAGARGSGVKLEVTCALETQGDPELLRRAVENVIRNAIRYEPQGSEIEVRVQEGAVVVRDHGTGVPEESLRRIFDPFYRVDSDRARNSGGVGLGLAIAKRAIELHQGHIRAENAEPGLRVVIELPTTSCPAEAPSSPLAAGTAHL